LGDGDAADVDHRNRAIHPGSVRVRLWPLRTDQADEPHRIRLEEAGIRARQDRRGNPAKVHRAHEDLRNSLGPDETVVYVDAVHPTHQAKPAGRWLPRGQRCALPATSGRDRLNLHGAIDLETGQTRIMDVQTVDAASTIA